MALGSQPQLSASWCSVVQLVALRTDSLFMRQDSPTSVTLADVLNHPVGLVYLLQYLATNDSMLAPLAKASKSISKFKKKVVPEKRLKAAAKIFKKYVRASDLIPADLKSQLAEQVDDIEAITPTMFAQLEQFIFTKLEAVVAVFKSSPVFDTLLESCGPKKITVSRCPVLLSPLPRAPFAAPIAPFAASPHSPATSLPSLPP